MIFNIITYNNNQRENPEKEGVEIHNMNDNTPAL